MATVTSSFIIILIAVTSANFPGTTPKVPTMPVSRSSSASAIDDKEFVMKAADASLLEIKAAEVASKTTSNPEIKSFAAAMIKDHGMANGELMAIAKKKSMTPRSNLSTASEQKLKSLSSKSGVDFDKAYAEAMVRDHQEAVELFKSEATNGKDAELKQWAEEKLPTLEHHLSMAQKLVEAPANSIK
ncbi:DUF4142 domain-containing protein [Chryseolinea sp. T2]|uniref:DUF4142 domain-containing protein n=1 Tax=Chryseolinea sp. T2 TaxID=3129255 RepID=UPI003077D3E3